ncbi:MAG: DUF1127 domain-containing protein [Pseudomonadota bacterium]
MARAISLSPVHAEPRPWQLLQRVVAWLRVARRVRAERAALAELDDRLLADIGIDRYDALREARRSPWDLAGDLGGR